jgi:signal peptidase I
MKLAKKIIKSIAYLLLGMLVTLCIYTFIMTDIMKEDYANVFGYTYFVVATGSMSGTIEVNDIVIVKLTNDVKLNDIITYKGQNDEFITHRLIKKTATTLITKGDVNNAEDDPITKKDVVGVVKMIISPSFLLKLLAVAIIIFILLALLNFDKIFKKYIVKEVKDNAKKEETVPEGVFTKNDIPEEKSTGNTVTIPINEVLNIKDETDKEDTKQDEIEILEYEEIIDIDSNNIVTQKKNTDKERETELLEQIINLLKIKNDTLTTTRINKKWLTKFQYVYKLINILLIGDTTELTDTIEHPPFKEIYDYDLDKAGLYENLRNKIYDMPIYVFLRILIFAILYNDDTFFDGVYKIMKYKVQVDKDGYFKEIAKNDTYARKQLKSLITFMQRITIKFDNKNVFQLERIEKYVKLKNYVNN